MKKILLTILYLIPVTLFAQLKYTINGKIQNLKKPAKVYLVISGPPIMRTSPPNKPDYVDSVEVKNGAFSFKGEIKDISLASLQMRYNNNAQKREELDRKDFFLDGGTLDVLFKDTDSISKAQLLNSKINQENDRYQTALGEIGKERGALIFKLSKMTPEEQQDESVMKPVIDKLMAIDEKLRPISKKFIQDNPNSFFSLMAFMDSFVNGVDASVSEPVFLTIDQKLRNTETGKSITNLLFSKGVEILGTTTNFTMNDVNDKPVSLSNFKGKFVLVDFWASWCKPCREENPNVVAAYNKYKDKNFTILGVSLDRPGEKEAWLKAIKDDGLVWTQVSDLKYWASDVVKKYNIKGVPFNFLVDPSGKIIAKDLHGKDLEDTLEKILK